MLLAFSFCFKEKVSMRHNACKEEWVHALTIKWSLTLLNPSKKGIVNFVLGHKISFAYTVGSVFFLSKSEDSCCNREIV